MKILNSQLIEEGSQEVGNDDLARLVSAYRVKSRLSVAELSRLSEMPESSITELEAGSKRMSLSNLYALCNILNIPPSEIQTACFGRH